MFNISELLKEFRLKGYTIIRNAFSSEQVAYARERIIKFSNSPQRIIDSSKIPRLNKNSEILYNVHSRDISLFQLFTRQNVLRGLLIELLNDKYYKQIDQKKPNYILRSMLARNGGKEQLTPHIDSFLPSSGKETWICLASLMLDDHTKENGGTIFVPKSHRSDQYAPPNGLKNGITVEGKSGDMVLWDGRIWHGTNANKIGSSRWAIIASFTRWWIKQGFAYTDTIRKEDYKLLSDEEKSIFGFCSKVPTDQFDRIDMKRGYEDLPSS